jgi:simple sugar transport system ATP-binding protein
VTGTPALELRGIRKSFGSLTAVDGVDLALGGGEFVGLLGGNGAGKSTLMRVAYGMERAERGSVLVGGHALAPGSPRRAIAAGLGMVHQHFLLAPPLTVAENVILGAEPRARGLVDRRRAEALVAALSERVGLPIDPRLTVADLPVGLRQRVEILKALWREPRILILDEPTAVLSPPEAAALLDGLRRMASSGMAIILISHRLTEVMAMAGRIVVMRAGRIVADLRPDTVDEASLAGLMVGAAPEEYHRPPRAAPGGIVLAVDDLAVGGASGAPSVEGVTLEVRAGEMFGVVGIQGNGQAELTEALVGLRAPRSGRVLLGGARIDGTSPATFRRHGGAWIPEDRHRQGMAAALPVSHNAILGRHRSPPFARGWLMVPGEAVRAARRIVERLGLATASVGQPAGNLSGGNQQKLVVGRELAPGPLFILAVSPTRGLDPAAVSAVHRLLLAACDGGAAVLLVSSDLDEVLNLADRVAVMRRGRLTPVPCADRNDRERLGLLMASDADRPAGGTGEHHP